jgi:rhodanese-related sulfurtransferase/rubrerythrin
MRWKQFLTPVPSLDADAARRLTAETPVEDLTILDVRQPNEYEREHLPGARLIPMPQLVERIGELDPHQTTLVYCAVGGRSRMAAQIMAAKGFERVYNLSGGIRAWNAHKAVGPQDQGLELFTGRESPEQTLVVAYALEGGLFDFYETMRARVHNPEVRALFKKLGTIEEKHQQRLLEAYAALTGRAVSRRDFEKEALPQVVEGGLSTEEYAARFEPDWESPQDVIALAMSIEAQALDLYQRAAAQSTQPQSAVTLNRIAAEEQAHLAQLGSLLERI